LKILIVDDETVSRNKLVAILEEFGECRAVADGHEAIAEVGKALEEQQPYGLITMDIGMPEMDGTEALFEIRRLEQAAPLPQATKAKIIMITAQNDRDCLITCVQAGCDDYIIKPFDPDMIIQRVLQLNPPGLATRMPPGAKRTLADMKGKQNDKVAIGNEVLSLFKRGGISLPSPPGIYGQFRKLVAQGADLAAISDILKEDMSLSFHLISISNSPYYRGVRKNLNLQQAIGRLGLELTRKYVDILSNRSLYTITNKDYQPVMESLWQHSVTCANAAELLTQTLDITLNHDPFTLGLLHDVGKMVLIQILSELEARGKIGPDIDRTDILGTLTAYHGPFGEVVLNTWNFPKEFGMVAKLHDNLEKTSDAFKELEVVQLANIISKSMGFGLNQSTENTVSEKKLARKLGADDQIIEQVKQRLKALMEETRKILA
jgi:HD-like signal output (HDOD) protein/CheY-like chemotaxis protein